MGVFGKHSKPKGFKWLLPHQEKYCADDLLHIGTIIPEPWDMTRLNAKSWKPVPPEDMYKEYTEDLHKEYGNKDSKHFKAALTDIASSLVSGKAGFALKDSSSLLLSGEATYRTADPQHDYFTKAVLEPEVQANMKRLGLKQVYMITGFIIFSGLEISSSSSDGHDWSVDADAGVGGGGAGRSTETKSDKKIKNSPKHVIGAYSLTRLEVRKDGVVMSKKYLGKEGLDIDIQSFNGPDDEPAEEETFHVVSGDMPLTRVSDSVFSTPTRTDGDYSTPHENSEGPDSVPFGEGKFGPDRTDGDYSTPHQNYERPDSIPIGEGGHLEPEKPVPIGEGAHLEPEKPVPVGEGAHLEPEKPVPIGEWTAMEKRLGMGNGGSVGAHVHTGTCHLPHENGFEGGRWGHLGEDLHLELSSVPQEHLINMATLHQTVDKRYHVWDDKTYTVKDEGIYEIPKGGSDSSKIKVVVMTGAFGNFDDVFITKI